MIENHKIPGAISTDCFWDKLNEKLNTIIISKEKKNIFVSRSLVLNSDKISF